MSDSLTPRPVVRRNGRVELEGRLIGFVAPHYSPVAKVGTVWGYGASRVSLRIAQRHDRFTTRRDAVAWLMDQDRGASR